VSGRAGERAAGPGPVHLLAGGPGTRGDAYRPLVAEILRSAGRPAQRVGYVGAATDDDPRFLGWMEDLVARAGPCTFQLAPVGGRRGGGGRRARQVLEAADVVLVGGGDVDLGMQRLLERDLVASLREKHARGTPFFGISAGAILLCQRWIRWRDPGDDGSAELFDCLGVARVVCDCHGEEDRWSELLALLRLAGGSSLGYGLRSGAALRVEADGAAEPACGEVDRFQVRAGKVVEL
jgi:cyanophycinase-like exopeptidase